MLISQNVGKWINPSLISDVCVNLVYSFQHFPHMVEKWIKIIVYKLWKIRKQMRKKDNYTEVFHIQCLLTQFLCGNC